MILDDLLLDALCQFIAHFVQSRFGGHTGFADQDQMPAEIGFDRAGDFAHFGGHDGIFKRLDHRAQTEPTEITTLRTRLLAHWLGCDEAIMAAAIRRTDTVGAGVEVLRNAGYARLRPILLPPVEGPAAFVAAYHLGDPFSARDSWRWWRRKAESERAVRRGREAMQAEG